MITLIPLGGVIDSEDRVKVAKHQGKQHNNIKTHTHTQCCAIAKALVSTIVHNSGSSNSMPMFIGNVNQKKKKKNYYQQYTLQPYLISPHNTNNSHK